MDISPPELDTVLGRVRLNVGDLEGPYVVSDEYVLQFIDQRADQSEIIQVYHATVRTLQVMVVHAARQGGRRREKEGPVEIEVYGNEAFKALAELLDKYLASPPEGYIPDLDTTAANKGYIVFSSGRPLEIPRFSRCKERYSHDRYGYDEYG